MKTDLDDLLAENRALQEQGEQMLASIERLKHFSFDAMFQAAGVDRGEFEAWLRAQLSPEELAEADRDAAAHMGEQRQALADLQMELRPPSKAARRRNMV
jgi:hypothetical protein